MNGHRPVLHVATAALLSWGAVASVHAQQAPDTQYTETLNYLDAACLHEQFKTCVAFTSARCDSRSSVAIPKSPSSIACSAPELVSGVGFAALPGDTGDRICAEAVIAYNLSDRYKDSTDRCIRTEEVVTKSAFDEFTKQLLNAVNQAKLGSPPQPPAAPNAAPSVPTGK